MAFGKKKNVPTDEFGYDDMDYSTDDMNYDETPAPKKKKSGAGALFAVLIALVLVAGIGYVVAMNIIGPSRGQCKEVVENFQEGCNELNITTIASCFDPKIANSVGLANMAAQLLTNTDPSDTIIDLLNNAGGGLSVLTEGSDMELADIFKMINLKVEKISLPGKTRKVRCKATFGPIIQRINIYITKKRDDVFIKKIEIDKT